MSSATQIHDYHLEVIRAGDGVGFGRRGVPDADLELAREQTVFAAQRLGHLETQLEVIQVAVQPVFVHEKGDQIRGMRMVVGQTPRRVELSFDLGLFQSCATRFTADLLQAQQLQPDDQVHFRVFAQRATPCTNHDGVRANVHREPLHLLEGRLEPWLAVAKPDGPLQETDYPLMVLEDEVLRAAQSLSWQDGKVEGGCWLVGSLFRQREPQHEIFGVIHTVFQAVGMKHDRFGLALSSETYVRMQEQLAHRHHRLGRPADLAMGFYHAHPFLPSELFGHESCSQCAKRADCQLSSAFLSQQDAKFHNAVFGRTAFAVQIVLGITAQEKFDLRMYCLDGGQFRQRGFYRVAEPPMGALDNLT